jgi:hypothetical protein
MKNLVEFMTESFKAELNNINEQNINEGKIKDEKEFREYAHSKLKEAFGDDYDEAKANEMVDGILEDNKELVDKGDWGSLVGILNKGMVK